MKKMLLLILKKKHPELTNIFNAYFSLVFVSEKYEFCAYLECIYFPNCRLKETFAYMKYYEIEKHSRNSLKYVHAKISALKLHRHITARNTILIFVTESFLLELVY